MGQRKNSELSKGDGRRERGTGHEPCMPPQLVSTSDYGGDAGYGTCGNCKETVLRDTLWYGRGKEVIQGEGTIRT